MSATDPKTVNNFLAYMIDTLPYRWHYSAYNSPYEVAGRPILTVLQISIDGEIVPASVSAT